MKRSPEAGYAMLAAVGGIAAFGYIAFELLASNRGEIIGVSAEIERARMSAAADAGLMTAIQGLAVNDPVRRWSINGASRSVSFGGMALTIVVEDERGKVPINNLYEGQVRKLFETAGASGERLDRLTAAFEDWQDQDDDRRASGAEAEDYLPEGLKPRNGAFRTVDEMSRLKGMDPQTMARLRPMTTVFFGATGGFSDSTAIPAAIAVMAVDAEGGPVAIERDRELAGQRVAIESSSDDLRGRALTVRVKVDDGRGGRLERSAIVELTGAAAKPYWIRALN